MLVIVYMRPIQAVAGGGKNSTTAQQGSNVIRLEDKVFCMMDNVERLIQNGGSCAGPDKGVAGPNYATFTILNPATYLVDLFIRLFAESKASGLAMTFF